MKSTSKLIIAAIAVAVISGAIYVAWPDAPPLVLAVLAVTAPAGWLTAAWMGSWRRQGCQARRR